MEEILKKINSDILTESVISELKEAFDAAVAAEKESLLETYDAKLEEFKKSEMIAESEKILDKYDAKFEEFKSQLSESKEKELEEYKSELVEALDSYLEVVVDEFLKENKVAIENEVKSMKSDAILEAFDTILVTAGVEVARIVESKEEKQVEISESEAEKVAKMEERYNKLLDESKELKAKNQELFEMGLKAELCEGLSVVQKDKFNKLAELVESTDDRKALLTKLEAIKESVLGDKVVAESKVEEKSETKDKVITESVVEQSVKADSSRFF